MLHPGEFSLAVTSVDTPRGQPRRVRNCAAIKLTNFLVIIPDESLVALTLGVLTGHQHSRIEYIVALYDAAMGTGAPEVASSAQTLPSRTRNRR